MSPPDPEPVQCPLTPGDCDAIKAIWARALGRRDYLTALSDTGLAVDQYSAQNDHQIDVCQRLCDLFFKDRP